MILIFFLAESKPLNCLLDDLAPLQVISESLDKTLSGFGNYREVAQHYDSNGFSIHSNLEEHVRGPTTALIEGLAIRYPELTVQDFAAVVREKAKRRDVAALLKAYDSSRLNRSTDAGKHLKSWNNTMHKKSMHDTENLIKQTYTLD